MTHVIQQLYLHGTKTADESDIFNHLLFPGLHMNVISMQHTLIVSYKKWYPECNIEGFSVVLGSFILPLTINSTSLFVNVH